MLFDPYPKYDDYTFTDRKKSAYLRKLKKEQAKYPLFSEQIASEQLSIEDEEIRRVEIARKSLISWRQMHARHWRESRALFRSLSKEAQLIVMNHWLAWRGPRNPVCLFYLIRSYGVPFDGAKK